ncbi:hypothetical protein ScPMuIL_017752 [Solemya velum]
MCWEEVQRQRKMSDCGHGDLELYTIRMSTTCHRKCNTKSRYTRTVGDKRTYLCNDGYKNSQYPIKKQLVKSNGSVARKVMGQRKRCMRHWVKDWPWRVGIWYGPLVIIIGMMFVVYVYLSVRLSRQVSTWEGTYDPDTERRKELLKDDIKPLRAYPFVYLAVSLFPLINRIQNAIDDQHPVFALVLLGSISAPLHGALNALVFGLDRETFSRLTPSQIKVAVLSHIQKEEIREYPIGYSRSDSYQQPTQEIRMPKFNNVQYSKLN